MFKLFRNRNKVLDFAYNEMQQLKQLHDWSQKNISTKPKNQIYREIFIFKLMMARKQPYTFELPLFESLSESEIDKISTTPYFSHLCFKILFLGWNSVREYVRQEQNLAKLCSLIKNEISIFFDKQNGNQIMGDSFFEPQMSIERFTNEMNAWKSIWDYIDSIREKKGY